MNILFVFVYFFIISCCDCFNPLKSPDYGRFSVLLKAKTEIGETSEGDPMILKGFAGMLEKKGRPGSVGIPRKRMELQFAVQMMRSSYNAADDLDFVPMDEFQRTFFLFRQDEWEEYRNLHPNVMQGDLGEALYFDFISFAQYAVIAEKMRRGKQIFEEKSGSEGTISIVRRDPKYEDNAKLPALHSEIVGDTLLNFIVDKYPTITPSQEISKANSSNTQMFPISSFLGFAKDILDVFIINSYALSADIKVLPSVKSTSKDAGDSIILQVQLKAPANLWSLQVLKYRKDSPVNDFEVKVLASLARKFRFYLQPISTQVVDQFTVTHLLKLSSFPIPLVAKR